jgi:MoaA/NifB/PqqE/SkfB family radical SAM enzyme
MNTLRKLKLRSRLTLGNAVAKHKASSAGVFFKKLTTSVNRKLGRGWVIDPRTLLYIEPSGTCNLGCHFCAYPKKNEGKVSMATDWFKQLIDDAVDLGYCKLNFTPTTGDVFMDKHFLDKLEHVEGLDGIESYSFYTNGILPTEDQFRQVLGLRKLTALTISIYGHDLETFLEMTDSNANSRQRLIRNLSSLLESGHKFGGELRFVVRTRRHFTGIDKADDEVCRLLVRFRDELGCYVGVNRWFDNWGGLVSQADVVGLDIDVVPEERVPKNGACRLILGANAVRADGRVTACFCRDQDGKLSIGDVNETPLSEILSPNNKQLMKLVEEQERDEFPEICHSCSNYQSIYSPPNPFGLRPNDEWVPIKDMLAK